MNGEVNYWRKNYPVTQGQLWNSSKSSLPLGNVVQQIQRESSEMLEEQGIPFCTDDQTVESHIKVSFLE